MKRTQYDVSVATADAYLTVVAAQQTAEAARAAVDSWQVLLKSIHALVNAQLRPGADESRVQAELAAAQTQLTQAEQAMEVARANLAQFVGLNPSQVDVVPASWLHNCRRSRPEPPLDTAANPLAVEQNAAIEQAQSQLKAIERIVFPQFLVAGLAYARGTGAELTDGTRSGWSQRARAHDPKLCASGFTVTFPVMDQACDPGTGSWAVGQHPGGGSPIPCRSRPI